MKKTISLIMFCASCAMGATQVDLTEKWDDNTADLSEVGNSSGQFSVVLTLDMSKLRGDTYFFTVEGKNPVNKNIPTTTIGYGYDSWQDGTKLVAYEGTLEDKNAGFTNTKHLGQYDPDGRLSPKGYYDTRHIAYTTMVFNYSYSYDAVNDVHNSSYNITMLKWDKDGNLVVDPIFRDNTRKGFAIGDQLTLLTISPNNVKNLEFYTGNFSKEESIEQAERMANEYFGKSGDTDSTVPEPTTATLSLLALSALIGRRRRHRI